jgi:hypothetical protein
LWHFRGQPNQESTEEIEKFILSNIKEEVDLGAETGEFFTNQ